MNKTTPFVDRTPYLDYARVFTMFLVVWGHLYNGDKAIPHHYIYSFHMPLFFVISGMLHKYSGSVAWKKYIRTLLVPFVVFNLLYGLFLVSMTFDIHKLTFDGGGFFEAYKSEMVRKHFLADGPTWFLLSLFYCKIWTDYAKRYPLLFVIWFVCFVFLSNLTFLYDTYFPQAIMAMPFFTLGFYCKKKINDFAQSKYSVWFGLVFLILTLVITTLHGRVSMKGVYFGSSSLPYAIDVMIFYLNGLVGSLMVLFFSSVFRKRQIVEDVAKSLITILCVQIGFIFVILKTIGFNASMYVTIILALIIVVLCYLIHKLLIKYCPFIIGK
ncbi:MAG: acyltransferase family protein [Prevotella sp.]|nr:acyltransferase family protein [Prevotella sp.]